MRSLSYLLSSLLVVAVLLVSSTAMADDWYLATISRAGTRYFLDKESIRTKDGTVRVTVFAVYSEADDSGRVGYHNVTEYVCDRRESKILRSTYLYKDGLVKQVGAETAWSAVDAGTVDELLFNEVCRSR